MNRIMIWGLGSWLDSHILTLINMEQQFGNIEIISFVSKNTSSYKYFEGKPIITPLEICKQEYDYIIIASSFYKEIFEEAVNVFNIPGDKIINGMVFKRPCFNWNSYIQIREKKPSFIAECCFGGYLYKFLDLQFNSPFIATRIQQKDYLKLIKNLDYYLSQPITIEKDIQYNMEEIKLNIDQNIINWGPIGYPILKLDDVYMHAIHANDSNKYIIDWNRRLARFNKTNSIYFMIIENDEIAEQFSSLPMKNKIGFYYKKTNDDNIVYLDGFDNPKIRIKYNYDFRKYVHDILYAPSICPIDFFKLINGEKDFYRFT